MNHRVKSKKKPNSFLFFAAVTVFTTAAIVYILKESHRIKTENELLSYEVW
jgi:hypothetical protein